MAEALLQDVYNLIVEPSTPSSPGYVDREEINRWLESEFYETNWGFRQAMP